MYADNQRNRGGGGGGRGPYRSASGGFARQNAAPYSRPTPQRNGSSQGSFTPQQQQQQPQQAPSQLSIRGSSSIPTQALVSNLAKGTSAEDVRQTFLQFGDIIRVKERRSADAGSVSFEVLFEERAGAKKAVEQLDRALADGRILSVIIEEDTTALSTPTGPSRARTDDAMSLSSAAPSPAPTTSSSTPLGPRSGAGGRGGGNQRVKELFKQDVATVQKAPVPVPRGSAVAPRELLQTRPLTAKERRQVATAQAQVQPTAGRRGANGATVVLLPSAAPKGPKTQQTQSLQSRLGGLPLAQRLGEVKGAGAAKSDLASLQAQKSKKVAKKAAATGASAGSAAGQKVAAAGQKKRQRPKGKKSAGAGAAATGSMEVD